MIDLLVAGGGPVGLGTALFAARRGLRVVVAEPRESPIDKACGEGLMPGAVTALHALGVHPAGRPIAGISYHDSRDRTRRVQARFSAGPGLGVRRVTLHAALSAAAAEAGVEVVRTPITGVRQTPAHVEAAGMRARYLAAADGLQSPLRRRLGLSLPSTSPRRYGLRRHYNVAPWSDHVQVHWSPRAEAYVTPVAGDLVGVAVLCPGAGDFETWLAEFPLLAGHLAGAEPATLVRGAGPLRQRARRRVAGRVLLVGDAAGYVDALTGEGVRVGLAAAAELVRCVDADRPQDYEAAWRRVTRDYRLLTTALVRASQQPSLRGGIVPAAAALPGVFQRALDRVAR